MKHRQIVYPTQLIPACAEGVDDFAYTFWCNGNNKPIVEDDCVRVAPPFRLHVEIDPDQGWKILSVNYPKPL